MTSSQQIKKVAVVGTGVIGASWTAFYLSRGLDVSVTDPAPGAEQKLNDFLDQAWPQVSELGLAANASRDRLHFTPRLAEAVSDADFVQENGPEREEVKTALFAQLDALAPAQVILASSSSGLGMSAIQRQCRNPERCVIGHPFNPPHIIPLVEVVGGEATSEETVVRAISFYAELGKKPIRIRKEVPGHVANRLQAALWREAVHLVESGVVSVREVDEAVSWGPGLRWGLMGPNLIRHLGGGKGGMEHFMKHLSGPFAAWWEDLGRPQLTPEIQRKIIAGVLEEAEGRSIADLEVERDRLLLALLSVRRTQT